VVKKVIFPPKTPIEMHEREEEVIKEALPETPGYTF